jgi:hypothetical protein
LTELITWDTNGIEDKITIDDAAGIFRTLTADVTDELDFNKRDQNDGHNGFGDTRDMRRIASVPIVLVYKWMDEEGIDILANKVRDESGAWHRDPATVNLWLKRRLRDGEWRHLRTVDGNI